LVVDIKRNWKVFLGIDGALATLLTIIAAILAMPDKLNTAFASNLNWYVWLLIIFGTSGIIIISVIILTVYCKCSWCPSC
jgi:hypothetical protein